MPTLTLPPLPFAADALEPAMSEQTVLRHYHDNHAGYLKKLLNLLPAGMSVLEVFKSVSSDDPLYQNAAQFYLHNLWWENLSPAPQRVPADILQRTGMSEKELLALWLKAGTGLFGSGWLWLVQRRDGSLYVVAYPDAEMPQRITRERPVLIMDLWEHAYYCQYGTKRKSYLENMWPHINWKVVQHRLA